MMPMHCRRAEQTNAFQKLVCSFLGEGGGGVARKQESNGFRWEAFGGSNQKMSTNDGGQAKLGRLQL
jgi:hypothetical protein